MVIVGATNIISERLSTGVDPGDRLLSRQYSLHLLSNMADREPISSSTQPMPVASLSEVNISNLMFLNGLNIVLNGSCFLFKSF